MRREGGGGEGGGGEGRGEARGWARGLHLDARSADGVMGNLVQLEECKWAAFFETAETKNPEGVHPAAWKYRFRISASRSTS